MKKEGFVLASIVVLYVLVVFNIVFTVYGNQVTLSGNVVKEIQDNPELINQRILLKELEKTNEELKLENQQLQNKLTELEDKVKELENQEKINEETCNLQCGNDEICKAINKEDGSVKFTCIRDPDKVLGAEENR